MDETQRLRKPAETQEEPEQALRRECAALSYRLDTATDALKVRRRMVSESHGEEEWRLRKKTDVTLLTWCSTSFMPAYSSVE